jgi:hypothetical protein
MPTKFPTVVATRLTPEDRQKLEALCSSTQRPPSELVRLLIRLAQPIDVPPVRFDAASASEVPCAAE